MFTHTPSSLETSLRVWPWLKPVKLIEFSKPAHGWVSSSGQAPSGRSSEPVAVSSWPQFGFEHAGSAEQSASSQSPMLSQSSSMPLLQTSATLGVEIVTVYNRADLIGRSMSSSPPADGPQAMTATANRVAESWMSGARLAFTWASVG